MVPIAVRARIVLICTGLLAVALVAVAQAALPRPGGQFMVDDHRTPGDNWHVDVKVNKAGDAARALVVHSERCGDFTPYATGVPIGADGTLTANGLLDSDDPGRGSWGLEGTFTTERRLDGQFRFVTPTCDTGPMRFSALDGDGHTNDSHGRTNTSGTPIGQLPDLSLAKGERKRELIRLYRASKEAARTKYRTYSRALRAGFVRYRSANKRPQLFHVRNERYARDGVSFEARKVESLVYYRPSVGDPILIAFMYRAPLGGQPRYGKPVLGWHSHGTNKKRLQTQMTHVWLTDRLRTALANCLPIGALERDVPGFRLEPGTLGLGHESSPCTSST